MQHGSLSLSHFLSLLSLLPLSLPSLLMRPPGMKRTLSVLTKHPCLGHSHTCEENVVSLRNSPTRSCGEGGREEGGERRCRPLRGRLRGSFFGQCNVDIIRNHQNLKSHGRFPEKMPISLTKLTMGGLVAITFAAQVSGFASPVRFANVVGGLGRQSGISRAGDSFCGSTRSLLVTGPLPCRASAAVGLKVLPSLPKPTMFGHACALWSDNFLPFP